LLYIHFITSAHTKAIDQIKNFGLKVDLSPQTRIKWDFFNIFWIIGWNFGLKVNFRLIQNQTLQNRIKWAFSKILDYGLEVD